MTSANAALIQRVHNILQRVDYPSYIFHVRDAHGGVVLLASYMDIDVTTKKAAVQFTRKWLLSPRATDSEIVQTAFKCILTSMEHRAREHFLYRSKRVFGPHYDIEDLVKIQHGKGARYEAEPETSGEADRPADGDPRPAVSVQRKGA